MSSKSSKSELHEYLDGLPEAARLARDTLLLKLENDLELQNYAAVAKIIITYTDCHSMQIRMLSELLRELNNDLTALTVAHLKLKARVPTLDGGEYDGPTF